MKEQMKKALIISILIVALTYLTGFYLYSQEPTIIATHWGANGQVNGYTNKTFFTLFMPTLSLFLLLLLIIMPKIDPLKKNYSSFQKEYDAFAILILLFFYLVYLAVLLYNLGYGFNMTQIISLALAALLFYLGILLGNAKQNWFIGIRTPWTLSNKKVWNKTHALGGKLFKILGIIALIGVLSKTFLMVTIAFTIAAAIILVIYSYIEFRKETGK